MVIRPVLLLMVAFSAIVTAVKPAYTQQMPPPVAMPAVPPHNCVKPEVLGISPTERQIKAFNTTYKSYGECMKKYINDAKALADAAVVAGNSAVEEFNKVAAEVKAQSETVNK